MNIYLAMKAIENNLDVSNREFPEHILKKNTIAGVDHVSVSGDISLESLPLYTLTSDGWYVLDESKIYKHTHDNLSQTYASIRDGDNATAFENLSLFAIEYPEEMEKYSYKMVEQFLKEKMTQKPTSVNHEEIMVILLGLMKKYL